VEHKVYYDEDHGIGHVDIIGELTRDDAERIMASFEDMFDGPSRRPLPCLTSLMGLEWRWGKRIVILI
jgi:hypothetical protein